jgi:16S rRNA (guanine1207-N2)-methyltransferase
MHDAALETLFWPFNEGRLPWPEQGGLFLRARDGFPLHERKWPGLLCEQTSKPDFDALRRAGVATTARWSDGTFPLVLILPPRQRDEARALFARAFESLSPGGRIIASMSNNEGARSGEADLERLAGNIEVASKNKCRVFWTAPVTAAVDESLLAAWRVLDAPRPIEGGRFVSRPGIFAWDRIDVASELLAQHLPDSLSGDAADLGAGFGYLSVELLNRCPRIRALDLYEAEQRALDLAKQNLESFSQQRTLGFHWYDVTAGLPRKYDVVITNPPFHAQRGVDRPDIGRRFISVAAESLQPRGRLWLVANRHLPYEVVLSREFAHVRTVTQQHGFKIVEALKR